MLCSSIQLTLNSTKNYPYIMSDIEMNAESNIINSYLESKVGSIVRGGNEPRKAINAINWSVGLKVYHTAIPCFLAFLM